MRDSASVVERAKTTSLARASGWYEEMSKFDLDYPLAAGTPGFGSASKASAGEDYELAQRLSQLPAYARSLLRIQVPVVVTLAETRQPVSRVLDLAPGTILHFNKACDDPLTVSIGKCNVAVGETVKVGDKFGLRLTSMVMPDEKFELVKPEKGSGKS